MIFTGSRNLGGIRVNRVVRDLLGTAGFLKRIVLRHEYRTLQKLFFLFGNRTRYEETTIRFDEFEFTVPDAASFLSAYEELIYKKIYMFSAAHDTPIILDFGANIGLSVLFFAKYYPNADVYAYEADPRIYHYLENNVAQFKTSRIHLHNAVIYDENTTLSFFSEGADGGHVCRENEFGASCREEVVAADAKEILQSFSYIDFLKMDIEGAERRVLPRIKDELGKVQNIFVEYHSETNRQQCLPELLAILREAGFRIYMHPAFCSPLPLVQDLENCGYDLEINIFGKRR